MHITKVIAISGSVSSSGNNLILTPNAGKRLRLNYVGYNPQGVTECAFRFGAGGALFLRYNIAIANSIVMKDLGSSKYLEGNTDESLYLNLTAAVTTIWNVMYSEVG